MYNTYQILWWEPFINQLAQMALDYGIDATSDDVFLQCTSLLIQLSSLN